MKIDALRRPFAPGTYDRRYVPVADGFRVLCVLFVGWFHIWQQSWLNPMLEIGGLRLDLSGPVRAGYMLMVRKRSSDSGVPSMPLSGVLHIIQT